MTIKKAYNRVNREFLIKMFKRGFSTRWIFTIKTLLENGLVGVRIND
jgi:hypothetical protein